MKEGKTVGKSTGFGVSVEVLTKPGWRILFARATSGPFKTNYII